MEHTKAPARPQTPAVAQSTRVAQGTTTTIPSMKIMITERWTIIDMAQAFNLARREVVRRSNIIQQPSNYMENIDLKWRNPLNDDLDHLHTMPAGVVRVLLWDIWTDLLTMVHGPCGWSIEYPPPRETMPGRRRQAPTQNLQWQPPVSSDRARGALNHVNQYMKDNGLGGGDNGGQNQIGRDIYPYTQGNDFQDGSIEDQDHVVEQRSQADAETRLQAAADDQVTSGVNAVSWSDMGQGFVTHHYGFGEEHSSEVGMRGRGEGLEELEDFFREQDQQAAYQGWYT